MDSSGNLYGTAHGGPSNDGTVFELAKGSGTITTLANTGFSEAGALVMDSSGNFYGTTYPAPIGPSPYGTVSELVKGSGMISTLASFSGYIGVALGGLLMDSSGNLYGTTSAGGTYNDGTLFELAKGSSVITTLATFNGTNGANTPAGLVMDSSGNLYGTTSAGGTYNDGTVFELAKGSSTITTLVNFNGTNGEQPLAPYSWTAAAISTAQLRLVAPWAAVRCLRSQE